MAYLWTKCKMGKCGGVKLVSKIIINFCFVFLYCAQGIIKALILNGLVTVLSYFFNEVIVIRKNHLTSHAAKANRAHECL
jgi:hypothetical protein